ncbi:hypothetical protein [Nostoc flagelliforme]|uniref:hypothetical protein n=1 Tax=Nostoc flagelliforme TaxID=1306274 RepID=UPI0030DD790A
MKFNAFVIYIVFISENAYPNDYTQLERMNASIISDAYGGKLRTPKTPQFHKCVAVRLVVRHRTLKVTNL